MHLIGIIRLGRDAEVRYTPGGDPLAELSGVWNYGRKDQDGKRPSQWAKFTLWGDRAEKLSQYLTKGRELEVVADDIHIETYEKRDGGQGFNLSGRVVSVEFTNGTREQGQQQAAPQRHSGGSSYGQRPAAPAAQQPAQQSRKPSTGFDDMDDDIPF